MTDDRINPTPQAVAGMVGRQFPQWAHLPVRSVSWEGWDNRTFLLGDDMVVRLPSAGRYAAAVDKEQHFLPRLAPHVPVDIPTPLARGVPDEACPFSWSVYRYVSGDPATRENIRDLDAFARRVAEVLKAMQGVETNGAPRAGPHNFFRGGPLSVYDEDVRDLLVRLNGRIDTGAADRLWQGALSSQWMTDPVWVHGDIAVGNLLIRDGRLGGLIDFGSAGIGDPACDLVLAWTFLNDHARGVFRDEMGLDVATWQRARGWALWKAMLTLASGGRTHPAERAPRDIIELVLKEAASEPVNPQDLGLAGRS